VSPLDKNVTNLQRLKHMTQRDSGLYMQVLRRLVGADEHMYAFHADSLQWLAEADLLEMLVDKLSPLHSVEVQSNAANILSAITCIAPCALTSKLSSPK
jgi:serine/threonine-protein phosphatase 6 regulatory subunit 3